MSTVTSGSRLRGKESTGQCRDEGAAGPEGSRGHQAPEEVLGWPGPLPPVTAP